jgi:EmrB/QacA subfamily drug resistance transporter
MEPVRFGTSRGRWVIAAAVLGSGVAFLDGSVVNVALPALRSDLHMNVAQLQWTLDAYLVTLTALLLLGGSLGDIVGRRRTFVAGLISFAVASCVCGIAPNATTLIAARAVQGAAAAFLVPGSLAIISATFHPDDRSRAIGAWSGLAGAASAIGPFVGGFMIDAVSWRLIFFINAPLVVVAVLIAVRHVPETKDDDATSPDWPGAATITVALAAAAFALIERGSATVVAGPIALLALAAFLAIERTSSKPMLPLGVFRSGQFTGANLVTFAVYAALGGAFFLFILQLQLRLGYSAVEAGVALSPVTLLMMLLSARAGALAQRVGPRVPMTIGPLVAAAGLFDFGRIRPGAHYATTVLPAVVIFGLGLTLTVAPLTAAVLAAADERHIGVASGVNNAVARLGSLIAVAALPALTAIDTSHPASLADGFPKAMWICAAACAAGGVIAFLTVRKGAKVRVTTLPSHVYPCNHDCLSEAA